MLNLTEWSRVSQDSFKAFEFDSGMLVKNFNPANFTIPEDEDIICTTTGNINASLTPTLANLGDDVNNLHGDFAELEYIQKWTAAMSFTALEMDNDTFKLALGAADIDGNKTAARMYLKSSDFETIALVMRLVGGGLVAAVMSNALSTGGVSISTSKEGKGNLSVSMTGFSTMANQSKVPMEFYSVGTTGVAITAQPEDVSVAAGSTATFSTTATGTSLTYQWQVMPDGAVTFTDISSAKTATLSLKSSEVVAAANGNKYRCKISDSNGYVYTEYATLTVTSS